MVSLDEKIIDPRTIYSLAMTAVLFEIYNSGILKSQNSLMGGLNIIILLLIIGQLSFLLMRGLSLAQIRSEKSMKILEASDWIYSYIFQASIITFFPLLFLSFTSNVFNYFVVPKTLFYKSLYFIIFFISVIMGIYFWKENFDITKTKKAIYIVMICWIIVGFFIIMYIPSLV